MSDPFEKAKAIRAGTEPLPHYEELTGWIQRAPATWLPGLLAQVVKCCVVEKVFQDGKLAPFAAKAEEHAKAEAALREKKTIIDAGNP